MGQLRSVVRALASTGLHPGPLLDALDRYTRRHGVGQSATLIYAELSLGSGELRFACAGHPPPVIVRPGDEPCLVWDGRSLPRPRAEASRSLTPGSLVLFFTDGLVERRSQPLTEGLDRLLAQVADHRDRPAETLAAAVVDALHDAEHADDVCLLAVRLGQPS